MEIFFRNIIEISIMVSLLIVAVLLIRLCFKKASATFRCFLWMLVGVRLLVPVSISSPFGLVPDVDLAAEQEQVQEGENQEDAFAPVFSYGEGDGVLGAEGFGQDIGGVTENMTGSESGIFAETGSQQPSENMQVPGTDVGIVMTDIPDTDTINQGGFAEERSIGWKIATLIWITGSCLMLLYMLVSFLRLRKSLREALPSYVTCGEEPVKVYRHESVDSPFLLGVISPKIYVPMKLAGKDLQYVLAHERMHLRRRDHLLKPLSFMVLALYWFHPLVWVAYTLLGKDIELACDERVMRENPKLDRAAYAKVLLSCAVKQHKIAVCPVAFGEVDVKQRVTNVLNYKKPGFWMVLLCVLLSVIVVLCFMTVSGDMSGENVEQISGENTTEPAADPALETTAAPTPEPTVEPMSEPTVKPTSEPTAEPVASPVPTMIPEDYEQGTIEGYTESQSKWIRDEISRRFVYETDESFRVVRLCLDSLDESGVSLGTIFWPKGADFHSLDVVNRIESVKMDGNDWLAVTVVANISTENVIFPYLEGALEILIGVDKENDSTMRFNTVYRTSKVADGTTEHAYYEENNYIRTHINLLKADVTHDGIEDYIETYMYLPPETDMTVNADELIQTQLMHDAVYVSVYDGSVATKSDYGVSIWTGSYSGVHAGNGQINLVYQDGLAYLMRTSVYAGQGNQSYWYEVYTLDAKGRAYVKETYSDGFYVSDYTQKEQDAFAKKFEDAMEPWLEGGKLIVGTDVGLEQQLVSTERKQYTPADFFDMFLK